MKYLFPNRVSTQDLSYQQQAKEKHIKQVFDLLRSGRCSSRVELAKKLHLSSATVSALVDELIRMELIEEKGLARTSKPGRRSVNLQVKSLGRQIAVFSLTLRGVRFTLFDLSCNILESFFVRYSPNHNNPEESGDKYASLFESILLRRSRKYDASKTIVACICLPGIYVEEENVFSMRAAMNVEISESSMLHLEERLGIPLFLHNMSMCLAYAEIKHMNPHSNDEGINDLIFINVCDGVSAGIISGGSIFTGEFNTAGEFGHVSVDLRGHPCSCGNRGCLEQYVNLNAIYKSAVKTCARAGIESPSSFEELSEIYLRYPPLVEVIDRTAERLAFGIYTMMCITGIRRIVVGGGIESLGEFFLEKLNQYVKARTLLTQKMEMSYPRTGSEGDSLGIAQYFLDKVYSITSGL